MSAAENLTNDETSTHTESQTQTKKAMPEECKGLCWGGFTLHFIWGIGNKTYIAFLTFVPIISLIMPFVLLFKGRQWAWENDQWENAEHFNRVQKNWSIVGLSLFLVSLISFVVMVAVAVPKFKEFGAKARMAEAKVGLAQMHTMQMMYQMENDAFTSNIEQLELNPNDTARRYKYGFANSFDSFSEYCSDCTATKDTFRAMAVGNIDNDATMDVWTIDHNKNVVHLIDDLKE